MIKEEFKLIKGGLKSWHQNHTQNLKSIILYVKDNISSLDLKDEVEELHCLFANLHSLARINYSMYWHKKRMCWLREGYANDKFFYGVVFLDFDLMLFTL